ncbi:MAG: 3-hydroxyanthranilate 3,4-dioxygenase [Planctomycetota bacterium]|nr:3-hydroxyanthranilate 3,4-dioxygenase [Planctomycetota bacterium]
MSDLSTLNLADWIAANRETLKPPVGNKMLWNSNFMVMVVAGPNQRKDYHVNPGEELFFQIEGDIVVRIRENGKPRDIPVKQGELFLLPSNVPHSPQRPAGTIGLVLEHFRGKDQHDHLRWFCDKCGSVVHDEEFFLTDLGTQVKGAIEKYYLGDAAIRTCKCGWVEPVPEKFQKKA